MYKNIVNHQRIQFYLKIQRQIVSYRQTQAKLRFCYSKSLSCFKSRVNENVTSFEFSYLNDQVI
jgi:hypothetical protein